MGEVVGGVLELVGEEAAAGFRGVSGVFLCAAAGGVDELVLVDDARGADALDGRAEFEEEVGFFGRDVGGHAAESICFRR